MFGTFVIFSLFAVFSCYFWTGYVIISWFTFCIY